MRKSTEVWKSLCKGNEGTNVRFNVVVFILIDRLLTDPHKIRQLLLADSASGAQIFQILDHNHRLRIHSSNEKVWMENPIISDRQQPEVVVL